ncbi:MULTISPECIES: TIGR02281 family clan AA aspartic protease [unclassified Chelatococcus]|uniref:retropepsin-like aspartic protease family protein n=1 Tax=unclassified Chelatococcus TaxID=2638111 RepID=UPI001BCA70A1|nr:MULTISPECIES: TIGR02281 family clan AA aspartic protease [unclassified Chelatococcus]CAH1670009.1 Aspartyl protease family protein [Hyphomicrobiales bacterium]MBS7739261.1 TIGR02281 family clan AA aspartic protease [Chelatococcus sp. HY11]MBX3546540.1 TIGR02281 family clan AA aspartic protease [Chelatococcus sp.]MCO5076206.1 TIGR02281 family clan AA aspartic protease [Chelatococcus sp.]CAH1678547.1 Aspartyl protease family protein [Hyphomicrobiales bacterium]
MRLIVPLAIIGVALVLLVLFSGEETIAGMAPDQLARFATLSAFGIVILGSMVAMFRSNWSRAAQALAFWMVALVGLVGLYSYRDDVTLFGHRILGELTPGRVVPGPSGEVSVVRSGSGSFDLEAEVNGRSARFILDTGASVVVLTSETAERIGFDIDQLAFNRPVRTANGSTMAAAITIDTLAVGPIVERRVPALVARKGSLFQNLLGMTFLERLGSYEVRGDRLIMRPQS